MRKVCAVRSSAAFVGQGDSNAGLANAPTCSPCRYNEIWGCVACVSLGYGGDRLLCHDTPTVGNRNPGTTVAAPATMPRVHRFLSHLLIKYLISHCTLDCVLCVHTSMPAAWFVFFSKCADGQRLRVYVGGERIRNSPPRHLHTHTSILRQLLAERLFRGCLLQLGKDGGRDVGEPRKHAVVQLLGAVARRDAG